MKRRKLLDNLAALVGAGAAAALLPVRAAARPLRRRRLPALTGKEVHYVSADRRHIKAILIHRYRDGSADLLLQTRPPWENATFIETRQRVPYFDNSPDMWGSEGAAFCNTWHEPEPYPQVRPPKPYTDWWLRDKRPADGPELRFYQTRDSDRPAKVFISKQKDGVLKNSERFDPDDEL